MDLSEIKSLLSFLLFMSPLFISASLFAVSNSEQNPVKAKNEIIASYVFLGLFGVLLILGFISILKNK